jgi:predicted phage tail protein
MHTIVLVKFSDPDNFGKDAVARVTCADIGYPQDLTQYGERVLEVTLPGCCSRGAATRHGRWVLITERLEDVTVAFGVGQEGLLKELGTLIAIQDEDDWDINVGGRILAVTGNTITLDRPITAPVGSELMVGANGQMVTYQISGTANNAETITVIGSATAASMENVWLLSTPTVKPTLWRLLSSSESDNSYGMQALKHDPAKYAIADNIGSFQQANSPAYANPLPPTNIEVTGSGDSSYLIGWSPSPTRQVAAYILQKQIKDSNIWQTIPVAPGYTDAEITTSPNIYRFRVASISFLNRQSDWLVSNYYGSFTGRIVSANPDGTVTLDRDVVLVAGKAYQIETIVHGIKDLRPIINAAGTYRVITTNPGYAGASAFFEWGNPATLPPAIDNKASAIRVVGSGIATAYSQQNFTGASQVFTEGLYLASRGGLSAVGNNAISSLQVAQNTTAYLYEGEPGENPQPASIWRLIEL